MESNNKYGQLASIAVLGTLFNEQHNLKNVLAIFVSSAANSFGLNKFTLYGLTQKLNEMFEFELPLYVVRKIIKDELKEKISLSHGEYSNIFSPTDEAASILDIETTQIQKKHDDIFVQLEKHVSAAEGTPLSTEKREKLFHEFSNYILNIPNGSEFSHIISTFIIKNDNNEIFKESLITIKEGLILYTGIKYSGINPAQTHLEDDLTIFLEQEVLFNLADLNGEIHYEATKELIDYVNIINGISNKHKITLKYLASTESQINDFFAAAEHVYRTKKHLYVNQTAMRFILEKCQTPSDIIEQKTIFFQKLRTLGIRLDTTNFSSLHEKPENYKYNIINAAMIDYIKSISEEDRSDKDRSDKLNMLNNILYLRKDIVGRTLDKSKYLLATGTNDTLKISIKIFDEQKKSEPERSSAGRDFFPTALHIGELITWLWFKVNKGFGGANLPKSYNIIARAQTTLNNQINMKFEEEYNKVLTRHENGQLSDADAQDRFFDLRKSLQNLPSQITSENIDEVENFIMTSELLSEIAEKRAYKDYEIKQTKIELTQSNNELLKMKILMKEKEIIDLEAKKNEITEKLATMNANQILAENAARKRFNITRLLLLIILIGIVIWLGLYLFEVKFDVKPILIGFSAISFILLILFPQVQQILVDFSKRNFSEIPQELITKYLKKFEVDLGKRIEMGQQLHSAESEIITSQNELLTLKQTE